MAQRKTDGAAIEQLKEMVLSLQEENAELFKALDNLIPLASREAASLASDEEATRARKAWRAIDKAKAVIAKAEGGAAPATTSFALSKPVVNMKRELMVPSHVSLTVRGFSIVVFTNDHGVCVQLKSDAQRPCETPLDEMQRAWGNKTA